jgi:hypothetical protein
MGKAEQELTVANICYLTEISKCNKECPIYAVCRYDRRARFCGLRYDFMKVICANLRDMFPEPDPVTSHHINFILMPLYQHLVSLRVEILSYDGILKKSKSGTMSAVYKELRETTKQIASVLKELGIGGLNKLEGHDAVVDLKKGDSGYYGQLIKKRK